MKPKIPSLICLITEKRGQRNKYELLEDNFDCGNEANIMSSLNNLIGLEDQEWFKIINIANNLVIELTGSKLICSPENAEKVEMQTFKATALSHGNFSISSRYQTTSASLQVWDYLPHRKLLVQRKESAGKRNNQSWVSGQIPGFQSSYFLISAPDCDKCIKSMGEGQQITIVDKSAAVVADPLAHWKLVQVVPSVPVVTVLLPITVPADVPVLPQVTVTADAPVLSQEPIIADFHAIPQVPVTADVPKLPQIPVAADVSGMSDVTVLSQNTMVPVKSQIAVTTDVVPSADEVLILAAFSSVSGVTVPVVPKAPVGSVLPPPDLLSHLLPGIPAIALVSSVPEEPVVPMELVGPKEPVVPKEHVVSKEPVVPKEHVVSKEPVVPMEH